MVLCVIVRALIFGVEYGVRQHYGDWEGTTKLVRWMHLIEMLE